MSSFVVNSENVSYDAAKITSSYAYQSSHVTSSTSPDGSTLYNVTPVTEKLIFQTDRVVPKVGLMLVGWGGNNGTTVTAGILANKLKLNWNTKEGLQTPNYFGSLTQASVASIGIDVQGAPVYVPMNQLLPMVHPNDLVLGGWDISSLNLGDALHRSKVLDYDLMRQLHPLMKDLKPLPSIYSENFIALNQKERANNVIESNEKQVQLDKIRSDIREFKAANGVDKVIVLWTATTERFADIVAGMNDTADNLLTSIKVSIP
jgi:myo-inositol-1-phosphate synthase